MRSLLTADRQKGGRARSHTLTTREILLRQHFLIYDIPMKSQVGTAAHK